jgi:hypothetical protein
VSPRSAPPTRVRREALKPGKEPEVHFGLPTEPPPPKPPAQPAREYATPEEASLRERIDGLALTPATDFNNAHPAAKRTAHHLKVPWRKTLHWPRGEKSGPIVRVEVSDPHRDRAVRVLDALLRAADALGWQFEAPPPPTDEPRRHVSAYEHHLPTPPVFGQLVVEDEPFILRIDERRARSDHVPTDAEKAKLRRKEYVYMPHWDYEDTGELRLHLSEPKWNRALKTWKDSKTRRLEAQIPSILHALLDRSLQNKTDRLERARQEAEYREHERQRELILERREAHQKLIHELEHQAGAWHRAQYLRRYLRAARRTTGTTTITANLQGESIDFLAWAEHYIDQLDPLHPESRDPDLQNPRPHYYADADKHLTSALLRLAGASWESAKKLGAPNTDAPDTEEDDDVDW